jgi:hypothetical protein
METETLKTRPQIRRNNNLRNASSLSFDLPILIEKMKHDEDWVRGEPNSMVLMKSHDKKILLMALHDKTKIKSFQSADSITFQIIEGKLKFHTPRESVTLDKGNLLTLNDNIRYSLTSREETVLLLTIAKRPLKP